MQRTATDWCPTLKRLTINCAVVENIFFTVSLVSGSYDDSHNDDDYN